MDLAVPIPAGRGGARAVTADMLANVLADVSLIVPYFQPIVDLRRGSVAGYELLSRFLLERGTAPAEWFELARELGRVAALDAAVVKIAIDRRSEMPSESFLTVNVTESGLVSDELRKVIAGQDLAGMVFELTAQPVPGDPTNIVAAVAELRKNGAMVAIDGAGTGQSSLERVMTVRPDFVKMDRSFMSGIEDEDAKVATVAMMGTLADRIDAWLVAEGIETGREMDRVASLGVPLAQGYLLGRPSPVPEDVSSDWSPPPFLARHGLSQAINPVTPAPASSSQDELAEKFAAEPENRHVPLLDEANSPVAIAELDASSGTVRVHEDCLAVDIADKPEDVLGQAMARPVESRFHPVVCRNALGRYLGLVYVERLVQVLIDRS